MSLSIQIVAFFCVGWQQRQSLRSSSFFLLAEKVEAIRELHELVGVGQHNQNCEEWWCRFQRPDHQEQEE